ncbi:MAG: hypothetical protein BGO77_03225 [Caedibacter sp. 37-49]|nr:MAG: hypothetical protein BGO77_03225 [Caedibacter sp. 37-49]
MRKLKLNIFLIGVVTFFFSEKFVYSNGYIGINLGYARNSVKPKINGESNAISKKMNDFDSIPAGFHFGLEKIFQNGVYTAAEVGMDFAEAWEKVTYTFENGDTFSYKVKKGNSIDLAMKVGYSFGRFIPYALLEVIGTTWKQKASFINRRTNTFKKSDFKLGIAPGVGGQFKINSHWTAGVEYKYAIYGKQTLSIFDNAISIKPSAHDVRARLSYNF